MKSEFVYTLIGNFLTASWVPSGSSKDAPTGFPSQLSLTAAPQEPPLSFNKYSSLLVFLYKFRGT